MMVILKYQGIKREKIYLFSLYFQVKYCLFLEIPLNTYYISNESCIVNSIFSVNILLSELIKLKVVTSALEDLSICLFCT